MRVSTVQAVATSSALPGPVSPHGRRACDQELLLATSAVVPVTLPAARRFARRAVHPTPLLSCGVRSSFSVSGEGVAAIARLHQASRALCQQRSHAAHPARTRALCAKGRASVTTASRCAQVGVSSQPARRRTAMPGPPGLGSLAPRAGRCLIGRRAGIRSAGHPLRFYIRPHFAKWPPVAALKLRLMSPTAARPRGFTKQALCKVSFAGAGGGVAPGHQPGAARTVGVSGLRPCILCVPPPTPPGPRRCAAWAPARRLPVRPPRGLPHPARLTSMGSAQKSTARLPSARRNRENQRMPLPRIKTFCTATCKATGVACLNPAAFGMPVCRYHGARKPESVARGKAHGQFIHGRAQSGSHGSLPGGFDQAEGAGRLGLQDRSVARAANTGPAAEVKRVTWVCRVTPRSGLIQMLRCVVRALTGTDNSCNRYGCP